MINSNPVPFLSKKNVKFIENIINEKKIDFVTEYGSGNSTIYFIKNLKIRKIKFVSIENDKFWFYENIKSITKIFNPNNVNLKKKFWTSKDYKMFYKTDRKPFTEIIDGKSRIKKIKNRLSLGPFYRFEKNSNSKFAGKLFIFYPIIKPLLILINSFLQKLNKFNNEKSEWNCQIEKLDFKYNLVSPTMKDQFGESPNIDDYVNAGLNFLENQDKSKNILFMIDGGPRHYIVEKIINKKYNHNIHICLFDAHRPEYDEILNKYNGTFFKGEEILDNDIDFYSIFPDEKKEKLLSKELWYFNYQN